MAKPDDVIKIEKLGKVKEWTFYKKPVRGARSEQQAYERGFRQRIQDWSQGIDVPPSIDWRRVSDKKAYELGYADARKQERP